jgi:hypothetical protein
MTLNKIRNAIKGHTLGCTVAILWVMGRQLWQPCQKSLFWSKATVLFAGENH